MPQLGIFAQTDPVGYGGDGPNLYAYVLDDPVNFVDPLGLDAAVQGPSSCSSGVWDIPVQACAYWGPMTVTATRSSMDFPIDVTFDANFAGDLQIFYWETQIGSFGSGGLGGRADMGGGPDVAPKPTGEAPFYFNGQRFAPDPRYEKPWWSDYLDVGFGCLAVCPLAAAGAAVGTVEGGAALAENMVLNDTWGVASSRFGNALYGARGSWNAGRLRFGWSYKNETGQLFFQLHWGPTDDPSHLWSPISTYVPWFIR